MGDAEQRVAAVFDRAAPTYDQVGVHLFGPVAELLVRELDPRPGERLLDVGCGRGAVLLRAAARGAVVTGIDLSERMVEAAREQARRAGLQVRVQVDDASAPDAPPASYEAVASSLVLFFLPDPARALRAWHALLVPGGRLAVTTFGPLTEAWRPVDAALLQHVPGARDARTTGRAGPFASDEGMVRLVEEAGFHGVHTTNATVRVRFDDADHWYRWSWSVAQRQAWEALPEAERPALRASLQELVEQARLPDGRLGHDQVARCTLAAR